MFGKPIHIMELFGFKVRLDPSWFIVVVLITWSLATGTFPAFFPGQSTATYWGLAVFGAFGLFASILLHEFAHAFVARKYGMPIRGITLFIFGGVAELEGEPPSPGAEFWVAIAGPIMSAVLGAAFVGLAMTGQQTNWGTTPIALLGYLGLVNSLVVVFNLIPAFPLDGGRVLRSIIWKTSNNLRKATRITSRIGGWFGILLIGLGVYNVLQGNLVGGIWEVFIGIFLRYAASASYQQLLLRQYLEGEKVSRFMHTNPVKVGKTLPVEEFIRNIVYKHFHKIYPVTHHDTVLGCVSVDKLRDMDIQARQHSTIEDVMENCGPDQFISSEVNALQALQQMNRDKQRHLFVIDEAQHLAGIVSQQDLIQFFSMKMELEDKKIRQKNPSKKQTENPSGQNSEDYALVNSNESSQKPFP